ncbi:MAG TPA: class I SAM-dependent methyltransferase [Steroidobacter sp.]|jgi:SAM-dependent methyltransferase|nr:class I SAM-dependent methyltransferase [Steroidobacteraceae bacterium]HLS82191.1 class I SAM-dependent methyltransferase [Steroidobacter sp.]
MTAAPGFDSTRTSASLPPLQLSTNYRQSVPLIEQRIRRMSEERGALRILEAGCGAKWPLDLRGTEYILTALDVDLAALEMRKTTLREVDEIMVGDLRDAGLFAASSFDVIYNSFVLEHVAGAECVLDNFRRWLTPGGLLVLRIPDRDSVYGFLARVTPFRLHVAYKKHVQGMKNAGKPGYDPYPTHYDAVVSRRGVHAYCRKHDCTIRHEAGFAGYLPSTPLIGAFSRVLVRSIAALSLGRLDWRHNNLTFLIEKQPASSAVTASASGAGVKTAAKLLQTAK